MSIDFRKSYGDVHATPGQGIYICRFLDHASVIDLVNFVHQSQVCTLDDADVNDLHCTVMYSPEARPTANYTPVKGMCRAHVRNFEHWPGHDDSGYLVAVLESDTLSKSHSIWKKRGCVSTFPEYQPHVTLKHPFSREEYNVGLVRKATELLTRKPLVLRFPFEMIFEMKVD